MISPERLAEFWKETLDKFIIQSVKNREFKEKSKQEIKKLKK